MDLRRYLAEEVAVNHADGLISRREALRQLALMGFSVPMAGAVLAACGGSGTGSSAPPAPSTLGTPRADGTQTVTYTGHSGSLQAAWVKAATRRGAVMLIHENRGLTDDIRGIAGRLAGDGYSVLAVDLLSEEGGTAALGDAASAAGALAQVPSARFVADMRSTLDELQRREPGARVGMIGFCFGGSLTWALLNAHEPRLSASIPFYGTVPDTPDFSGNTAAVLAIYAGLDDRVNATRPSAESALQRAALHYEVRVFPNVNHAFFNPSGPRYDAPAAQQAYSAVLDWFGRYLT